MIGPIEGLTTAWHLAPRSTAISAGSILLFRTTVTPEAIVTWSGADEISRDDTWSTALCFLPFPGAALVRVTVSLPPASYTHQCTLDVVDIPLDQITVSPINVSLDPLEIHETLPPEDLNPITMAYFFGDSIAAIRPVGEGLYRTSINRMIPLQVEVDPPGFAPLIEWRVDGSATKLGSSVQQALYEIGLHTISAGPPAAEQTVDVDTYEVIITSHVSGEDIIPEGEPVVFTAVTDPPGYENDITWLSSTKYGTASPVLGEGPVFVAEFNDTWGPHPDGGLWQWFGAKADNAKVGQDQKQGSGVSLTIREFVGRPTGDLPNGAIYFVNETLDETCGTLSESSEVGGITGATTEPYTVTGDTLQDACNNIFNTSGPVDSTTGKRHAGVTELAPGADWRQTGTNPANGNLIIHVDDVCWKITVKLPQWDPPDDTPQDQIDQWNMLLDELQTHEQGHVDRYNTGMNAVKAALVCTSFEVPAASTDDQISDEANNNMRASQPYMDMEQSNADYDAPFDDNDNPEGTNHGTENGQNASWPSG